MRAFLAVEVSGGIRERLEKIQLELPSGMRPVNPENIHITLKFLGEISGNRAGEISRAMDSTEFSKFPLICKGLGAFPSEKSVRVLWAGIESPGLVELHSRLEPKLAQLGFEKENFTPHLTIARARDRARLDSVLSKYREEVFGECVVSSFSLKKSALTPKGPVYENIHSASVKD